MTLAAAGATVRYGETEVLRNVSVEFRDAELTAIVGPNGAGKSTLLGALAGLKKLSRGKISLDGRPVHDWERAAFARRISFVPQLVRIDFPFTVLEVAMMGRASHARGLFESSEDRRAAEEALDRTDTLRFRDRDFRSLSGGERQRVILAAALAQKPEALLLDEPTTFLDLKHQVAIFETLRSLAQSGLTVATVTHDLAMAVRYATRVVVLCCGEAVADGPPQEALTPEAIRRVFEVSPEMVWPAPSA
ncbi:MAG: ABC transporter ATP-binding protein [Bryobacteraceae bacterium]|nr:ABC transporter ATP-binding protein [Bryobacteraceae bacterium]